SSKC
ncbi:type II secretion system (T2SS), F family protein, partial [Vibrio parahaemolyticus V-223/04]